MEKNYDTKISKGKYIWYSDPTENINYKLINDDNAKIIAIIQLTINIEKSIFNSIDTIEIYDENGHFVYFNKCKLTNPEKITFSLKKNTGKIKIQLKKRKILSSEEYENMYKNLKRWPSCVVSETLLDIPEQKNYNLNSCFCDEAHTSDLYLYCGHEYHQSCIWKYLEANNKLNKNLDKRRIQYLGEGCPMPFSQTGTAITFAEFKCPNCQENIEN